MRLATREGERALVAVATPRSRGGRAALTQVYQQHHQALYRYCRALLRDDHDAQDALQSTMTRAFAALRDERRDFELRPWLFRIAHNEAISMLRRRRPVAELDELVATAAPVEEQVALHTDVKTLREDIAALPERQRAALLLRELNGLSHDEIGQALDCRPEVVKQAIYQARTTLMLAREGREMECGEVRRALSDGDGRVLRSTRIQAHLRSCKGCRGFQADLARRPAELALLAPPLPVAAGVALLERLLPGAGAGAAGALAALAPKAFTTLAVVAATATGASTVAHHRDRPAPQPVAAHSAPAAKAPPRAAFTRAASPSGATPNSGRGRRAESPGKSGAAKSRSRSAEAKTRGVSAEAKTRGRSDQAKTRGVSAEAKTRGRSDQAKSQSRSAEAKTRGRSDAAKARGRSAEAKTRSRSDQALRGHGAAAQVPSRSTATLARARSTAASTRPRSGQAKTRSQAVFARTGSPGAAAPTRSRSAEAKSRSRAAGAQARARGVPAQGTPETSHPEPAGAAKGH